MYTVSKLLQLHTDLYKTLGLLIEFSMTWPKTSFISTLNSTKKIFKIIFSKSFNFQIIIINCNLKLYFNYSLIAHILYVIYI